MKKSILIAVGLAFGWSFAQATDLVLGADDHDPFFYMPFFHSNDVLAPRDDWGLLHQSRTTLYETDFAPRYCPRAAYYGMSGRAFAEELLAACDWHPDCSGPACAAFALMWGKLAR